MNIHCKLMFDTTVVHQLRGLNMKLKMFPPTYSCNSKSLKIAQNTKDEIICLTFQGPYSVHINQLQLP